MSDLCRYLALGAVTGLLVVLNACNPPAGDSGPANSSTAAVPETAPAETIGELVALLVAGDGKLPVKRWIDREQPEVEAYSFLEYPPEFGAGFAYYWGDWTTRADNFCAVRMLSDYTPVQTDFTLGWYAQLSGRSVEQLLAEFKSVHAEHAGTIEPNVGRSGETIGDMYLIDTDEYHARLFLRDDMGLELAVFALMVPTSQIELIAERNRRFPELLEFATQDQPATLAELVSLLADKGARGMLDHFDFREFKRQMWYTPLDGSDVREYSQATKYGYGALTWNGAVPCYLAAFDDGAQAQLTFASGWYERHCGYSIAELDAAFEELLASDGQGRISLDSARDAYDVDFAWAYANGVNVIRRAYLNPPRPGHAHYMLRNGPPLFSAATSTFPSYSAADLPAPTGEPDALESLLRELATKPMPEIIAARVVGAVREETPLNLQLIQPFTMRNYYTVTDPITQRRLCAVKLLDDTYLESFGFNHQWFTAQAGLSPKELEQAFAALAARRGVEGFTLPLEPGATAAFDYGPLTLSYWRGDREDRSEDWYSVSAPLWP